MVAAAKSVLLSHPLRAALARAPIGESFSPEQRAELDQRMKDIHEGRTQLVHHEDRGAWRETHPGGLGDSDE